LDSLHADIRKEEVEINEKILTDAETKKKEELVKSMKSQSADFEKRYPGRGKEVMYATATKMAKKIAEQMYYEPEDNVIDELTKYAEKTGKKFTTLRKSVTGGNPEIAARNKPPFKYGGSRQQPKDRTGKVVPATAGEPGSGRQSPKHIVDIRRANKERAREQRPGSKYD